MSQPASSDQHVRLLLGTYLLGGLGPDEQQTVEAHLTGCAVCSAECDELSGVTAMLGLLSLREIQELAAEFDPVPQRPAPRVQPRAAPPRRVGPASRRPRFTATVRGRARLLLAATAVAVMVGGVGVGVWWRGAGDGPRAADASTPTPPALATLSVTITTGPAATTIRAVVLGIAAGTPSQLLAVTVDGQTLSALAWTAAGGRQTVVGAVNVPAEDLAFVCLVDQDGTVLASVRIVDGTPSPAR